MEEEKRLDQHAIWSYKYIGVIPKDELEYMLIDLEAKKPFYIPQSLLDSIRENNKDINGLRVYFCEKNGQIMLEPFWVSDE